MANNAGIEELEEGQQKQTLMQRLQKVAKTEADVEEFIASIFLAQMSKRVLRNWSAQPAAAKVRRLRCMGALLARLPAAHVASFVPKVMSTLAPAIAEARDDVISERL